MIRYIIKRITVDNNNQTYQKIEDLLQDEQFIKWRLFRTEELDEYWNALREENPQLKKIIDEAVAQFGKVKLNHYPVSDPEKQALFSKIRKRIRFHNTKRVIMQTGAVAAVLAIAFLSILYVTQSKSDLSLMGDERIVGQTLPDEDVYIITNGEKIKLTDKSHIGLTEDGRAVVTDSSASTTELTLAKTDLNKLMVPYGKRSNLTLADGSKVWLNSGTQLDFPTEFNGKTREIYVDGEIYIDVAHNAGKPFVVNTGDMQVLVTGTSFNLSAYGEDGMKTVVLVNGKVDVNSGSSRTSLVPNEKLEITDRTVSKETVDVSQYISWKDGVLELNSTSMTEILKRVGRYYNVQFEKATDVTLNENTFSGKLFLSNNLDSVMTSISRLTSTEYLREYNKIFISKKTEAYDNK